MSFPNLGISFAILVIITKQQKTLFQKIITMVPTDRFCFSEQFGISFAKIGAIFD